MIPRGIIHAASGAEVPLPLNILDAAKTVRPERGRDFARELGREIRRHDDTREAPKPEKPQAKEGERVKESNLGDKTKEPEAAWDRKGRRAVVEDKAGNGPAAKNERPSHTEPELANTQLKPSTDTQGKLDEVLIRLIEVMAPARRVDNPGPGGSAGLDEGKLGPRFAELAPNALLILRGNQALEFAPIAVDDSAPPVATEGLTSPAKGLALSFPELEIEGSAKSGNEDLLIRAEKPEISPPLNTAGFKPQVDLATTPPLDRVINETDMQVLVIRDLDPEMNQTAVTKRVTAETQPAPKEGTSSGELNRITVTNRVTAETQPVSKEGTTSGELNPLRGEIELLTDKNPAARLAELVNRAWANASQNPRATMAAVKPDAIPWNLIRAVQGQLPTDPDAEPILVANKPVTPILTTQAGNIPQPGIADLLPNSSAADAKNMAAQAAEIRANDTNFAVEFEKIAMDTERNAITAVRLRLHPPDLGQLVINFRRDENGLRIEFHAQNPAVMKMIEDAGPKMMERLSNAGVDIGSLDVFLNNEHPSDQRTFSPLDNPGNRPGLFNSSGELQSVDNGVTTRVMYFAGGDTTVDLLI